VRCSQAHGKHSLVQRNPTSLFTHTCIPAKRLLLQGTAGHISPCTVVTMALYDDSDFFTNYLTLPRQQQGHGGAPEWPILRSMVGSVTSQKVLDLGCGLGWFARYAVENGASHVDALDTSRRMISRAQEMTPAAIADRIHYRIQDINELTLEANSYDLIYSSLTFHYLPASSFTGLLARFRDALRPGGRLVFSCEHPIYTAPTYDAFISVDFPSGEREEHVWPLNRYGYEGLRETNWLGGHVKKYHRTMTTYVQSLIDARFIIRELREYMATAEDLEKEPQWKGALERPIFLMVKGER